MKRMLIAVVFVTALLGKNAEADIVSIGCAALLPKDHNALYDCNGARLVTGSSNMLSFFAPLVFSDGTKINKIILETKDESGGVSGGYVRLRLIRARFNTIQILETVDTGGPATTSDTRLEKVLSTPVVIDNSENSYHLEVVLLNGSAGAFSTWFYKAFIDFQPPPSDDTFIPIFISK